jgi:hypothetical protein
MPVNLDTLRAQPLTLIGPATQTLADGGSIGNWRRAMEQAIRRSQTAAMIAGVAARDFGGNVRALLSKIIGPSALAKGDRARLEQAITAQLKYLDGFVADLRQGKLTMAQAQARAALYAGASRATFYGAQYPGLNAYPGDGGTPCMGNCKCSLEQQGDLIYWRLHPAEHCDGCVSRASASPYHARAA